ncbi:hypothetical protein [Agrobacterium vitis]|uniref:Uncharacterized protein n=1 Tax=Agrobacterium vitis TaxID=373 RepID=A0A7K1RN54_AGRVI|nr:hypothetical protein [Agrobacterium vitis]MVA59470.1 hypothetical protein [Agrobacterium vitis]
MHQRQILMIGAFGLAILSLLTAIAFPITISPLQPVSKRETTSLTSAAGPVDQELNLLEITARPLMSPTRRPFVKPQPPPMVVMAPLLDTGANNAVLNPPQRMAPDINFEQNVKVLGISGDDRIWMALLASANGELRWLQIGDEFAGAKIVRINRNAVELQPVNLSTSTVTLYLYPDLIKCEGCP